MQRIKAEEIFLKECSWQERRKELLELFFQEEYGFLPSCLSLESEVTETDDRFCAGKVSFLKVKLTATLEQGTFSFPISVLIPKNKNNMPFFVFINFRHDVPDKYFPVEEICDRGYAVLSFCYEDVTRDNDDFDDGFSGVIFKGRKRENSDCGKIAMWSWAASRILDYAESLSVLNHKRATVIGHSRLGKTALLTGALDERFFCTISNDSGCSGAALSKEKKGERLSDITSIFPFWFCPNYLKYAEHEKLLPFDQHFLLTSIAPRRVYVASAREDLWADPSSEHKACIKAGKLYEKLGYPGLCGEGYVQHGGYVAYHLRDGTHYLSREDWNYYMDYLDKESCFR